MTTLTPEFDELRLDIERLRILLENLVVRGLRACGPDELMQLQSSKEYLERAGAGNVASILASLHGQIANDSRTSAQTLLKAQTAVRLLERLLTLRIVGSQYHSAIQLLDQGVLASESDSEEDEA